MAHQAIQESVMNDLNDEDSEEESSSTWILLQIADSGTELRLHFHVHFAERTLFLYVHAITHNSLFSTIFCLISEILSIQRYESL